MEIPRGKTTETQTPEEIAIDIKGNVHGVDTYNREQKLKCKCAEGVHIVFI
jgi:hypothetical protein